MLMEMFLLVLLNSPAGDVFDFFEKLQIDYNFITVLIWMKILLR